MPNVLNAELLRTQGLDEGIRCAMCTNPMANDRGCDGACVVNDIMYKRVMEVIKDNLVDQKPKTGHWIYKNDNWHCSECGETPKTLGYVGNADFMREHFKFCNHCGCRMSEVIE